MTTILTFFSSQIISNQPEQEYYIIPFSIFENSLIIIIIIIMNNIVMNLFLHTFFLVILVPSFAECEKTYAVNSLHIHYPPLAQEPTFPVYSNLLERIQQWNPDNVELSSRTFRESIQHFNYSDSLECAMVC